MWLRRISSILIIFCIITSLSGCFNRIPGKIWKNPNLEDMLIFTEISLGDAFLEELHENNVITSVKWQKLRLSEDCVKEYPELSAAFNSYNEESENDAKSLMDEFSAIAKDMDGDEENPTYCQAEAKNYIQRADNYIVSFLESGYQHTGGVHPNFFVRGINYNTETGKEVALTDVLTDTKELPTILDKKICEKYSDVTFFDLDDTLSKYKLEEFTWTVDYQGITFWFSPYEIAPFAVGTLSARIWFDEFPDMFNKDYVVTAPTYAVSLPIGMDMEFDLKADDGVYDSVCVEEIPEQYGSYNMLRASVNDKTFTDEINYAYNFDAYLVHIGDKNYIYSDSTTDNDYHMFSVLDINGDAISQIDLQYSTGFFTEIIETGCTYKQVLNDPLYFALSTRFDILGTRSGVAHYRASETDGIPEMTDDAFDIESDVGITTRIPLDAELLPDKENVQLSKGTVLYPLRTDGNSYIDMKTEDGRELRFKYDKSEFPHKVNGISEEECFETLIYAG